MSNWSFMTHITDYLARPRLGEQKAPTQWPSEATAILKEEDGVASVVGKCRRASYFRLLIDSYEYSSAYQFYKPLVEDLKLHATTPDSYLRWIWKQGLLYEDYCVDLAKESGVYIAGQTQIYVPEYNISGKLDIIVIDPKTEEYKIVEVKSVYGYNANKVLGTPGERKKGQLGKPREGHLMQLGIYQWWYGNKTENFGSALLVYGARDTGRYAEYVLTVEEEDGLNYIFYKGNAPQTTKKTNSGISIESILEQYKFVANCLDSGQIPDKDYKLAYSDEDIDRLYTKGELTKKDTEQYEKRKKQLEEGKNRVVKAVEKGDWQCRFCNYKEICYAEDSTPRDLAERANE